MTRTLLRSGRSIASANKFSAVIINDNKSNFSCTCELRSEESFQSLCLGGGTPSGVLQTLMENIHIYSDLPWWGTIVTSKIYDTVSTGFNESSRFNDLVFDLK